MAKPKRAGPGKVLITLNINGAEHQTTAEPCVTLLDAIRDNLGLTGAKRGCDRATCGACTVLLDGKRVYACGLLAIDVQGSAISTVEGLGTETAPDPLQQAFIDNDAMQCGFCTPGFVMSCKAFLTECPSPTDEQILTGLSGNICRCGSYVGIHAAVRQAAAHGPTATHLVKAGKRRRARATPRARHHAKRVAT